MISGKHKRQDMGRSPVNAWEKSSQCVGETQGQKEVKKTNYKNDVAGVKPYPREAWQERFALSVDLRSKVGVPICG